MSKIYHLNDLEEFFGADDWKLQIDVTDIWNRYQKKEIQTNEFKTLYYNRMIEYKKDIVTLGDDVWTDVSTLLTKMVNETNETKLPNIYDEIYDWADDHDILIKTK